MASNNDNVQVTPAPNVTGPRSRSRSASRTSIVPTTPRSSDVKDALTEEVPVAIHTSIDC